MKNNSSSVAETPTTSTTTNSTISKVSVPPILLTNSITNSLVSNNVVEASPKKKPRKQLMWVEHSSYLVLRRVSSRIQYISISFGNLSGKRFNGPKMIGKYQ